MISKIRNILVFFSVGECTAYRQRIKIGKRTDTNFRTEWFPLEGEKGESGEHT